ncbi:MAG: hypothetical protein QOH66_2140 [Actinomycetota bacterium]|jgi:hypothetical protein|nr:hypothetical protein [Actinomycetota bacterium]MEA2589213.1 hypothetical protein [Actinomycetota bacterium]
MNPPPASALSTARYSSSASLQAAELVERAGEAVPCPGPVGMVQAELALADFLHGAVLRFSVRDPAGRL